MHILLIQDEKRPRWNRPNWVKMFHFNISAVCFDCCCCFCRKTIKIEEAIKANIRNPILLELVASCCRCCRCPPPHSFGNAMQLLRFHHAISHQITVTVFFFIIFYRRRKCAKWMHFHQNDEKTVYVSNEEAFIQKQCPRFRSIHRPKRKNKKPEEKNPAPIKWAEK